MREKLDIAQRLTKEDIKRAASLSLYTYEGATADEWQDQADALREGNSGEETKNEDANISQMIAEALRELDEEHAYLTSTSTNEINARESCRISPETSIQLAKLWVALKGIQNRIDNEVIPLGLHLSIEDPELMQALETLSERIREHFSHWRLVAERRRDANH